MKDLENIHPGEILKLEFLDPLNISAYKLAQKTGMPESRVSNIIAGKRGISADTALRLGKYFGTTPIFWLKLQDKYDLEEEMDAKGSEFEKILKYDETEEVA